MCSNTQHKLPQTEGRAARDTCTLPTVSAGDIPVPEKGKHLSVLGRDLVLACLVYCAIKFAEMIGL